MSDPVPLAKADLSIPFVYDRTYGVFYVPFGYHQAAMATLYAWSIQRDNYTEVAIELDADSSDLADAWLDNIEGAAFKSSMGKKIQLGHTSRLTPQERRAFSDVTVVFD